MLRELNRARRCLPSLAVTGRYCVGQVLRELGVRNGADIDSLLANIATGIPIKKLMLVVEMSLQADKTIHPGRFAATLAESGLLTNL